MRLQSKPVQLADYLRQTIRQGTLTDPLPGMRLWSRQLGVSRRTLHMALQTLQREGLLVLRPRGARLKPVPPAAQAPAAAPVRRVRWLIESTYRRLPQNHHLTFALLHERLRLRGIGLKSEVCTPARLREIARQTPPPGELLLLGSLAPVYQRLFSANRRPALVIGEVAAGLDLPYVNTNLAGVVRHATFRLLRRGCAQLRLVHVHSAAAGIKSALAAFQQACDTWPKAPVTAQAIATDLDLTSLLAAMRRVTACLNARTGVLVLSPVPVAMVVTALLQAGAALPARAEVVAVLHAADDARLCPPPASYPWPMQAMVREITRAVEQFFNTGRLPPGGKLVTAELAATT